MKKRLGRIEYAILAVVVCMEFFGGMLALGVMDNVQDARLLKNMQKTQATITAIYEDTQQDGGQPEMHVSYTVEDAVYGVRLHAAATQAVTGGNAQKYAVGDAVEISYNPQKPHQIGEEILLWQDMDRLIFNGVAFVLLLGVAIVLLVCRRNILKAEMEN